MIYLLILLLLFTCCILERFNVFKKENVEGEIAYFFLLLIFIILAGFRYRVGGDTLAYIRYFNDMPYLSELTKINYLESEYNPFWYLINAISKFIYDDFTFFQIIHASIVNIVIFRFFYKYSYKNKFILVLFYFLFYYFYFNMEILRESLAISFFLISYKYLIKKRWVMYYLMIFLAFMMHSSAVILFIVPFFYKKFKKKYILYIVVFIAVVPFINIYKLFSSLSLPSQIGIKSESYLTKEINIYGILMQLFLILPTICFYFLRKKNKTESHVFQNSILFYIFIGFLSMMVGGAFRFLNYFSIINLVYIVDSYVLMSKSNKRLQALVSMSFLFFYQGYYYLRDTSEFSNDTRFYNLYYPYYSIIDPIKDNNRENIYYNKMNLDW